MISRASWFLVPLVLWCGDPVPAPPPPVVLVMGSAACGTHAQGSGVVVAPGVVVTNAHVVQGSATVKVDVGGRGYAVSAHILNPQLDLCLLRVPGLPLTPTEVDLGPAVLGEPMVSVGFPGGRGPLRQDGTLKHRWGYRSGHLLQVDIPARPGNSGGGIFTPEGRLKGITSFTFLEQSGFHVAVPAHWVVEMLEEPWVPGDVVAACEPRESLLHAFLERMTEDAANQPAWEAFTQTWVADHPRDPEGWYALGGVLLGRLEAGVARTGTLDPTLQASMEAAYRRVFELNPGHYRAWNNHGAALDLVGKGEAAVKAFRMAVRLKPDYALAWINLGGTCMTLRQWAEAEHALRTGLSFRGDHPAAWARLGFVLRASGKGAEAVEAFERALRYQPWKVEWWVEALKVARGLKAPEAQDRLWTTLKARRADLLEAVEAEVPRHTRLRSIK